MSTINNKQKIIALDADGVLLNYNSTFAKIWYQCFGEQLTVKDPNAYHAVNTYGVQTPEKGSPFWSVFDKHGWKSMEPLDGAVDACKRLAEAGYRLVCVTSMPSHREADRFENLKNLGFPIERVIATGHKKDKSLNPKKEAIEALMPDYFVDDEIHKLMDLPESVKCVFIDRGHNDRPNIDEKGRKSLFMATTDLTEFAYHILNLEENVHQQNASKFTEKRKYSAKSP